MRLGAEFFDSEVIQERDLVHPELGLVRAETEGHNVRTGGPIAVSHLYLAHINSWGPRPR